MSSKILPIKRFPPEMYKELSLDDLFREESQIELRMVEGVRGEDMFTEADLNLYLEMYTDITTEITLRLWDGLALRHKGTP